MDRDFNNYNSNFIDYNMQPNMVPPNMGIDMNELYKDPMFNPIMQYEHAYYYYRYLCMQMEYKIKCKEYDKLCEGRSNQRERKIE